MANETAGCRDVDELMRPRESRMNKVCGVQSRSQAENSTVGLNGDEGRGDKAAIELFIAGIQGGEAGLRRRLDDGKSKPVR
jgi:hypothetical protein